MKKVEFELSDKSYEELVALANVSGYLNQKEFTPVDIAKAALVEYLEKYFKIDKAPEISSPISLGSHLPLKNRIGEFIKQHPLNVTEIAKQLKVDKSTLSNIVNNKNQPSLDIFLRIWFFLGCPPLNEILYREAQE